MNCMMRGGVNSMMRVRVNCMMRGRVNSVKRCGVNCMMKGRVNCMSWTMYSMSWSMYSMGGMCQAMHCSIVNCMSWSGMNWMVKWRERSYRGGAMTHCKVWRCVKRSHCMLS